MRHPGAAARNRRRSRNAGTAGRRAPGAVGEPLDDAPLPSAMAVRTEPNDQAVARRRERHEHPVTPVLREAVPLRADPLDFEFDERLAMRLRLAGACHFGLEVGFRERPHRRADRHGRLYLAVDDCPSPLEQR